MENNLEQQKKIAQENLLQLLPPECAHLYMIGEENGVKQPHYIWVEDGQLHLRCIYLTANGTQVAAYSPTFGEERTKEIYKLLKKHFETDGAKGCEHYVNKEILNKRTWELDLPVRARNCLKYADIETVRDLVKIKNGRELLRECNFGKRSLTEITEWLTRHNLHFGMEV